MGNVLLPSPLDQSTAAASRPKNSTAPVENSAYEAAKAFEGYFLAQVLQNMFAGISADGPFGGGPSEELFRSLLNDEYAKTMARSGGVGIADAVYREILKLQETTTS